MDFLVEFLQNAFALNQNEAFSAAALFEKKLYKKGALIQSEGQARGHLYILETGVIREFYMLDGKEITKWLSMPPSILVDLSSYFRQGKTRFSLQALQDATVYQLTFLNYAKLKDLVPAWTIKETELIAKCFTTIEGRLMQFLSMTAEERYLAYFNENKKVFTEVPQQYIASLLGMTPETLSRMRAKG